MTIKRLSFIYSLILTAAVLMFSCGGVQQQNNNTTTSEGVILKEKFKDNFKIGTIFAESQINGGDELSVNIVKKHFNALTAEDCMKGETVQPEQGKFNFSLGDKVVDFAKQNNMYMVGHVLVWHSQPPKWIFTDKDGNFVNRDTLIERMKSHIFAVAGHYKGKIDAWDVVNEAFEDDGSYRKSPYFEIIGSDFINLAFKFAHEADPSAKLILNDYNVCKPEKRASIIKKIKEMRSEGLQVDYVGMQMHCTMDFPSVNELESALKDFEDNNIKVQVTEFDLTTIPFPMGNTAEISAQADYQEKYDPYKNGLSEEAKAGINKRFKEIFSSFVRHSNNIERVSVWGITDGGSWRLNWPIKGRTDFPTLFYKDGKMKEFLSEVSANAPPVQAENKVNGFFQQVDSQNVVEQTDKKSIDEDGEYNDKNCVALYIHTFNKLPKNYITKSEAQKLGWDSMKGNLNKVAPGKSIGGDRFGNYEGQLPKAKGRQYYECDIDYKKGKRNAKRIIFSNDGLVFFTKDHYKTFEQLY